MSKERKITRIERPKRREKTKESQRPPESVNQKNQPAPSLSATVARDSAGLLEGSNMPGLWIPLDEE